MDNIIWQIETSWRYYCHLYYIWIPFLNRWRSQNDYNSIIESFILIKFDKINHFSYKTWFVEILSFIHILYEYTTLSDIKQRWSKKSFSMRSYLLSILLSHEFLIKIVLLWNDLSSFSLIIYIDPLIFYNR